MRDCKGDGCKTQDVVDNPNNYYYCPNCSRNQNVRSMQRTLEGIDNLRHSAAKRMKLPPPLPASKALLKHQKEFKALGGIIRPHSTAPTPACATPNCCYKTTFTGAKRTSSDRPR